MRKDDFELVASHLAHYCELRAERLEANALALRWQTKPLISNQISFNDDLLELFKLQGISSDVISDSRRRIICCQDRLFLLMDQVIEDQEVTA